MIKRREAQRHTFQCDLCLNRADIYSDYADPEYPEGWTSFPELDALILAGGGNPNVVLCPEHAHLKTTARLINLMLNQQAATAEKVDP